ncbi:7354_t:CDS:2 [Dentiscutata erythropus]|uniref:7354_t:CDS:1 n=1 Tax=Dentiscutata erythropus TaxID=1348616 RepID=A0A9N9G812_9GLOM|nr:7354_t:CDS:2 [Dentiscutata erythropus]
MLSLAWTPLIKGVDQGDCSTGEGKRDCHSGSACSSNNDCVFKSCQNFVCVHKLSNGCLVGGKKNNCNLGDPCASSDDCKTPGCEADDSGNTFCV